MVGNISITDMYMSVLSSLSVDEKLDLIAKLTNSIRNTYTKDPQALENVWNTTRLGYLSSSSRKDGAWEKSL